MNIRNAFAVFFFLLFIIPSGTQAAGNTITLNGTTNSKYSIKVPDDTLLDATHWTSTAVGPSPTGTTGKAAEIFGIGSANGGKNLTWRGGIIKGSIPTSWDWTTTHDFGGAGVTIHNNGLAEWQYARIHNVEDAVKIRELPEYSNTGSWLVRESYFTAIRDDVIDNDRFEPGTVQDSLFDGIYTFLSEQNENVGSNDPIGPNEDTAIHIKRVLVRSYPTNKTPDGTANRFVGPWFKWQGRGAENHKAFVSDSIFAVGQSAPDMKWSNFEIPPQVSFVGNNNFILWLGAPGGYKGARPAGVTFLEGPAAEQKWISARNAWLTNHGLPAQTFSADYNPHTAPIEHIPVSGITPTPPPDTVAPSVSILAPVDGALVSGQVTISAAASDNIGVTAVQFKLNGTNIGTEDSTAPYAVLWDTATVPDGNHMIAVMARDAAENVTTSANIVVTVRNTTSSPHPTPTPTTTPPLLPPPPPIPPTPPLPPPPVATTSTYTLVIPAMADAMIVKEHPSSNYGSAKRLEIDSRRGSSTHQALWKFTVTGLTGTTTRNAKLRIYNVNSSKKGGDFYRVAGTSWTESGITWNNAPSSDATPFFALGRVKSGHWQEVNITGLITGNGVYTILGRTDSSDGVDYASKESAHRPHMVIEIEGTGSSTQLSNLFGRLLGRGVSGHDVELLQKLLIKEGVYDEKIVSGYFGGLTEKALKRFQNKHNIDQVGQAGPVTRRALNKIADDLAEELEDFAEDEDEDEDKSKHASKSESEDGEEYENEDFDDN